MGSYHPKYGICVHFGTRPGWFADGQSSGILYQQINAYHLVHCLSVRIAHPYYCFTRHVYPKLWTVPPARRYSNDDSSVPAFVITPRMMWPYQCLDTNRHGLIPLDIDRLNSTAVNRPGLQSFTVRPKGREFEDSQEIPWFPARINNRAVGCCRAPESSQQCHGLKYIQHP